MKFNKDNGIHWDFCWENAGKWIFLIIWDLVQTKQVPESLRHGHIRTTKKTNKKAHVTSSFGVMASPWRHQPRSSQNVDVHITAVKHLAICTSAALNLQSPIGDTLHSNGQIAKPTSHRHAHVRINKPSKNACSVSSMLLPAARLHWWNCSPQCCSSTATYYTHLLHQSSIQKELIWPRWSSQPNEQRTRV
jgi:hypothetical protein